MGYRLPTWVPAWTSPRCKKALDAREIMRANVEPFDASKGRISNAIVERIRDDKANLILKVQGILVGVLDNIELDPYGNWRRFATKSGYLIYTSYIAQVMDEVWMLLGGRGVYVLHKESHQTYSLASEAMVWEHNGNIWTPSNIMFGEMIEQEAAGRVSLQSLTII